MRGSVTPRTKTTEELYPVDAGGGLRLASTLCTFSYIREGQQVQSAIGCINTSNRPVRLELHSKESSGLLAADYPRELAPGQTAEINLMYLNPEGAPRYGSLRDALEVRADGRGNGTLIGASANVIVAGMAQREGHPIHFMRFLIWSIPVMLISVLIATIYLHFQYFV